MKRVILQLAALAAAFGAAGLLVVSLGLVPIAASSGHWAVPAWFLHFAMRRSVQTQALGVAAPPALDDATLVVRGAGHFDSGCAPCHGAPGTSASAIARAMEPPPRNLDTLIGQWKAKEMFWIVKHGVKYTGMPAWVAPQRDDEVWAVVAFLSRLPELDAGEYRKLAHGAHDEHAHGERDQQQAGRGNLAGAAIETLQAPPQPLLDSCARCHHRDGSGRGDGAFPRLAGQTEQYLFAALQAFAAGTRFSGIMQPLVAGLDKATLRDLARHYASQEQVPVAAQQSVDRAALRRGEDIAKRGIPQRGVPSCIHCHGPSQAPRNPYYPILAGQYAEYLVLQLELFSKGNRGGSPFRPIMTAAAHRLEADQIRDVAAWYAALESDGALPAAPWHRR